MSIAGKIIKHLVVVGILVAAAFTVASLLRQGIGEISTLHTVTLTESGFEPQELRVEKGDTVQFTTTRDELFWPASNLHPSHERYPAFDAKQPIAPDSSWSFMFNELGEWGYHDHFASQFGGVIVVGDGDKAALSEKKCSGNEDSNGEWCVEELLATAYRRSGLRGGFMLLRDLYANDKVACHGYAHVLGEIVYRDYRATRTVPALVSETSYCGFGFWHGFMDGFARGEGDKGIAKAKLFCDDIGRSVDGTTPTIGGNCYHGIGIGLVADPPPFKMWGNPRAVVTNPLVICDTLREESLWISGECYSGVFHALIGFMSRGEHGLSLDAKDPLAVCNVQAEWHRRYCFLQLAPQIPTLLDNDLTRISSVAREITGPEIAEEFFEIAISVWYQHVRDTRTVSGLISLCRYAPARFHIPCLVGLFRSMVNAGVPGAEYQELQTFCTSQELSEEERRLCYTQVVLAVLSRYGQAELDDKCRIIPENVRPDECNKVR